MEIRVNVAILVTLGLIWAGLTHTDPVAALDPQAAETTELATLEDAFAHDRGDLALAEELAEQYLWLNQPGLAVGALRSADPTLLDDDPMLLHQLARAYEASGQLDDALATSDLALARCARSLGTIDAATTTPAPVRGCDARGYALLDMHRAALGHMRAMGIADPASDPRVATAYDRAFLRARVASAE